MSWVTTGTQGPRDASIAGICETSRALNRPLAKRSRAARMLLARASRSSRAAAAGRIRSLAGEGARRGGGVDRADEYFAKKQREDLAKLKASLAKTNTPLDEKDEKKRLQAIIEKVNVRLEIREELATALLLCGTGLQHQH